MGDLFHVVRDRDGFQDDSFVCFPFPQLMEHAPSPCDEKGAHESQNMMSYDHIPDKENEEEGEEDAEKTGDMAGPLQEREQDEKKEGEELNCDSHSEVSFFGRSTNR